MSEYFADSIIEGNSIFQELIQLETATAKEVANNVDVSKRTVERELSELEYYGEITKTETSGAFEPDKWHSNVSNNGRIKTVSIDNLFIDPYHARSSKDSRVNDEFRNSIERHGVINPLIVREADADGIETNDSKGSPEAPAGDQEYYIVAGKRRYEAAVEVGILEIDCVIKDYTDEEAASVSLDENEQRIALSQFELAKSIKKRYDILKEDLVGENEEVECPDCGEEYNGRQGLKTHIRKKHERSDESSYLFTSQRQIYEEIAESTSFDWRTVQRLIQVANIPGRFQPFVKIPEERGTQMILAYTRR